MIGYLSCAVLREASIYNTLDADTHTHTHRHHVTCLYQTKTSILSSTVNPRFLQRWKIFFSPTNSNSNRACYRLIKIYSNPGGGESIRRTSRQLKTYWEFSPRMWISKTRIQLRGGNNMGYIYWVDQTKIKSIFYFLFFFFLSFQKDPLIFANTHSSLLTMIHRTGGGWRLK